MLSVSIWGSQQNQAVLFESLNLQNKIISFYFFWLKNWLEKFNQ